MGFTFDIPTTTTKVNRGKRSQYPIMPDPDGSLGRMVARFKLHKERFEASKAECETIRPRICDATFPQWCRINSNKEESTHLAIQHPELVENDKVVLPAGEMLVCPIDKYGDAPQAQLETVIGPDILRQYFKPKVTITIKSDNLPEGPATQVLFNELVALFARHGQAGALEIKQHIMPRKGFVDVRHRILSPEQNLQLNAVCPTQVQLKTKGRGE